MRRVLAIFVVTRLTLLVTILSAVAFLSPSICPVCRDLSANPLLSGLASWDGAAYFDIARAGYARLDPSYAAYFPLYPLLMSVGGLVGGGDAFIVVGLLVSNAACLAAAVLLPRLAGDDEQRLGLRAAAYLLIFPTTIFLSALYADSLFIALAIASALAAQRSRWWASGFLAALAALTRPFGILAAAPLAVALWQRRGNASLRSQLTLLLPPVALGTWVAYLYSVTGDPLAIVHGYTSGFTPRQPLQAFTDLLDPSVYGFPWFVAGSFALFVALTFVCWRRMSAGLAGYATLMMLVIGAAGSLASSMRYELAIFPAFVALAAVTDRAVLRIAWTIVSISLALLFAAMFALYYWIG